MTFPYSANLGDRDPLEVLASTAAKIAALNQLVTAPPGLPVSGPAARSSPT